MSEPLLRRSKRARKQTRYNEASEDEDESQRSRKLTTPSAAKPIRRKRGLLQRITEFPLDVVFDIFSHCTPHDLLNLSRTSKHLRNLLLSRSTSSVWKSARSNVELLPPCPDDMSEPAYAHLCFDMRCHHCDNKHPAVNLMWHCRTRSCHSCLDGGFYSTEVLDYDYPHRPGNNRFYPTKMGLDLWEIIKNRGDVIRKEHQTYIFYCHKTLKTELLNGLEAHASDTDLSWKERMIEEGEKISQHVKELEVWSLNLRDERQADLQRRRVERENEILQRLVDAGWGDEIEKQRELNGLRIFREFKFGAQAKKLTDKEWDSLEPRLEAALEAAKERRLTMEFRKAWYLRYETFKNLIQAELDKLPFNTIGPGLFDLADLPQFQEKLLSTPIEHELTEDDMKDVFDELPQIRASWVRDRKEDLIGLLKTSRIYGDAVTADVLHRASTIFTCKGCTETCVYPGPLMHRCKCNLWATGYGSAQSRPSIQDFMSSMNGRAWTIKSFILKESTIKMAKTLMRICEIPEDATVNDVRDSRCWVKRLDAEPFGTGLRFLYPVVRAMYEPNHCPSDIEECWVRADDEAWAHFKENKTALRLSTTPRWMCNRCERVLAGTSVWVHFEESHNLFPGVVRSRDVTLPIDAALYALSPLSLRMQS